MIYYLPLYGSLIWDNKNVNVKPISCGIKSFNWEKSFEGKNVHDQVYLFNKMIKVVHIFIPNKVIICSGENPPLFIMKFGKS